MGVNLNFDKAISFKKDPNYIVEELAKLNEGISQKLIRKFNRENDQNNYDSHLTELKFINLFTKLGFEITYEKSYGIDTKTFTPDLTLNFSNEEMIAEIYRLGMSSIDSKISSFVDDLQEKIEEISSSYILEMKCINENNYIENFNLIDLKNKIEMWISKSPLIGDFFNYNNQIIFYILELSQDNKTYLIPDVFFLTIKEEKLNQIQNLSNNEITKKINKYEPLITSLHIPYFLCIEIDFLSGFSFIDFKERFHSSCTKVLQYEKYREIWTRQGKGSEWTLLGDFYDYSFLSGIIILSNHEYKILLSPIKSQIVYQENYLKLLEFLKNNFDCI